MIEGYLISKEFIGTYYGKLGELAFIHKGMEYYVGDIVSCGSIHYPVHRAIAKDKISGRYLIMGFGEIRDVESYLKNIGFTGLVKSFSKLTNGEIIDDIRAIVTKEEEGTKIDQKMFEKGSKAFMRMDDDKQCEIICNQNTKERYIERLSQGRSFYVRDSNGYLTFSIENAVKLRDWLNDMIDIAEESGYFKPPIELTLAEIEEKLGYRVKVVG